MRVKTREKIIQNTTCFLPKRRRKIWEKRMINPKCVQNPKIKVFKFEHLLICFKFPRERERRLERKK